MRHRIVVALLLLTTGCGDDDDSTPIPAEAAEMVSYLEAGVELIIPRLREFDSLRPFLHNPGSPGAASLVFTADPTPGAPPNSYAFTIPLDSDGDGTDDTILSGVAALNGDPAIQGVGFGGHLSFAMETLAGLGSFAGEIDYVVTAEGRQVSGSGTFTESVTGNTTVLTVDGANPLLVNSVLGAPNPVANACSYQLDGDVRLEVTGPTGSLIALWNFLSGQASVPVTGVVFTDNNGQPTELGDSNVTISCGASGSINDWAGSFLQYWACLPLEFGQAELTITVSGPNTISISDEDPPGSGDMNTYSATTVPGNPHLAFGYFIAGPPGNTYREDFGWILDPDGNGISDISSYEYVEGPSVGAGGFCGGTADRIP